MPLDFPSNPTNGQQYDNYYFDSTTGAWRSSGTVNALAPRVTALELAYSKVGLIPVIPSSVTVSSGSATVGTNGVINYSGVGTLDIDGIFTSTYRNYRLVAQASTTANPSEWQNMQFRTPSGNNAAATYESLYAEMNNGGGWNAREVQSATTSAKMWPTGNYFGNFSYDIFAPNVVLFTNIVGLTTYVNASAFTAGVMQIGSRENTAYTGLRIFGTGMSGTLSFYGYN